jgi:hypothetical protein
MDHLSLVTNSVRSPWRRTKSPARLGRTVRTWSASVHVGILSEVEWIEPETEKLSDGESEMEYIKPETAEWKILNGKQEYKTDVE